MIKLNNRLKCSFSLNACTRNTGLTKADTHLLSKSTCFHRSGIRLQVPPILERVGNSFLPEAMHLFNSLARAFLATEHHMSTVTTTLALLLVYFCSSIQLCLFIVFLCFVPCRRKTIFRRQQVDNKADIYLSNMQRRKFFYSPTA